MGKILIIGNARHGKDEVAKILADNFHFTYKSSSRAANDIFIYDLLRYEYGYKTSEICFQDRVNHREQWFDLITEYNAEDPSKLCKEILKDCDAYIGMRNPRELKASYELFDLVVWVDASERVSLEPFTSMQITKDMADIIIDNNGTLEQLEKRVIKLGDLLYKRK